MTSGVLSPSRAMVLRVSKAVNASPSRDVRRRAVAGLLMAALIFAHARPATAYLKFGVRVNDRTVTLKWAQMPVRYFVTSQGVPGVAADPFRAAVGRAFATWQELPTASITYDFAGFTSALPDEDDGMSTLGFLNKPELDRVLATTSFLIDDATGTTIESDIFFNSAFPWSVAENGDSGRFDVQSIALHEIGHLSGLGHSAIGETELRETGGRRVIAAESIMFPIAFAAGSIAGRTLKADDIAGISDLYPGGDFAQMGSISGRVTKEGQPLFGAHIVAFDPASGSLVGNFTLNAQGQFSIAGLAPGPHVLRVEPLDDADLDSFFESTRTVDVAFRVTYHDRLVVVPQRGDSGGVNIEVVHK
jgi:Matrixin/Carboxypeptidase regulatory-like domain